MEKPVLCPDLETITESQKHGGGQFRSRISVSFIFVAC